MQLRPTSWPAPAQEGHVRGKANVPPSLLEGLTSTELHTILDYVGPKKHANRHFHTQIRGTHNGKTLPSPASRAVSTGSGPQH